ncbi:DUF11 domain-containing protein [Jiangella anatolica]|uniref:DUF7927 domain-containing protein n=1 Tax=Jiangella anatolica TaxID=2670374 RepID=A0A2W2BJW5_9ACTN|nr:DUF11 domain-containing protein [Jiangella anatolica]PZF86302.1 hypothetical protein C1I92_02095 [Jiangella anatolica]
MLALLSSLFVLLGGAGVAQAATPVYEITTAWVDPPASVTNGTPVVAEWRINVNDADNPPSNEPVDNVTATFRVDKAFFDQIPDICKTEGVDPVSSLNEAKTELTCNFGQVAMGTALVLQTPVVANGNTNDQIVLDGTSPGGENLELPPILIRNPFQMDIEWVTTTAYERWNSLVDGEREYVDVDLTWSIRTIRGSDRGPDDVEYRLRIVDSNGNPVTVGTHPTDQGHVDWRGVVGCTAHDMGPVPGHPYSSQPGVNELHGNFLAPGGTCTLTPVAGQPGFFDLEINGINYDLADAASRDSVNNLLPPNWSYVATGSVWVRVLTDVAGSVALSIPDPPTYESPVGNQESADLPGNNTANKPYNLPGGFSAGWVRPFTESGGQVHDDTYRVPPGTTIQTYTALGRGNDAAANEPRGLCTVLDTAYVDFDPNTPIEFWASRPNGGADQVPGTFGQLQYYTGPVGDPNDFNCGTGTWSASLPPNPATSVTAVRFIYQFEDYGALNSPLLQFRVPMTVQQNTPIGQDVWTFGSFMLNNNWPDLSGDGTIVTPTDDARYDHTNGRRDIVRIVTAAPYIEKEASVATATYGVPVEFTLTYSATGSGNIPPTVDDYGIRDVLPLGMTYEPGSADPEPVVTTDPQGRQVLTWTLDGVTTNVDHTLTYQAVVDSSVPPGTPLTNTAESSLAGFTSTPVDATVTTTTNGYTFIMKMADPTYIPFVNDEGVGTGSWTVTIESRDPAPQAFTDTIDILPYIGDQRGTAFHGTYTLSDVVLPNGGTVYYTDADPATLSDDPAAEANGAPNAPSDLWTTTRPENPTAIRVIGGELPPGEAFGFQVVIETEGAQPQDVYVNRAQARAGHTELVMRTSAPLYVSDYAVAKTSDPAPGSTVKPGDTITYTITVTQEGPVPAAAVFTDTLAEVLDDAVYNNDVTADIGTATYADGVLSWEGVVPVGEVATITFSVTAKDVPALEADGADTIIDNSVWSPVCPDEVPEGEENPCEPPPLLLGYYTVSKTSDPAPGTTVGLGDVITYQVQITQVGEGAVEHAFTDDNMTAVLDDATYNDDAVATSGEVTYSEPTLSWDGPLAVGEVVDLTYSVTVTGEGDYELKNVVTSECAEDDPDCLEGICVPAPDQNPDCTTIHWYGDYEVMKTSDPVTGSEVEPGDVITYTVTVTHKGIADVEAGFDDDLTQVLDDATWNDDVEASLGEFSYEEPTLTWSSVLSQGDVATVTYSVTVTAEGDRYLENVVTPDDPEKCVPAPDQDEACKTVHINGSYTYSKTSDPVPGSVVEEDGVITYTVLISHVGEAPVEGAWIEDDLSAVLDDAVWNDDATADSGEVSFEGTTLRWDGDLAIDQVVTLTYSVTANAVGEGDDELRNIVTTDDERGVCVPAPDGNPDCKTDHYQGEYVYSKTSDPEPGSEVEEGEVVTYTVTVEHVGAAPIEDAIVVDDLSQVAPVADWNDDATATSGSVSMADEQVTWTGDLAVGQVVTITYSVTVGDEPNATMRNVVTSPDDRAVCVPAADGNPDCRTDHHTPDAPPAPDLPDTGAGLTGWFVTGGMVLLIGGLVLVATHRRRPLGGSGGPLDPVS